MEEEIDVKECIGIEELINNGTYKEGDILYLQSFKCYRRNYYLKILKDKDIRYVSCNRFLRDIVHDLINGCCKKGTFVVIGNNIYNPKAKHTEHTFLRDNVDKVEAIEDIIENDKIELDKKKYGKVKCLSDGSKEAPYSKEVREISDILKPNTPFNVVAFCYSYNKEDKDNKWREMLHLLKININNIETWVLVKGKTYEEIWNNITIEDNNVSYTYKLVNNTFIKEL